MPPEMSSSPWWLWLIAGVLLTGLLLYLMIRSNRHNGRTSKAPRRNPGYTGRTNNETGSGISPFPAPVPMATLEEIQKECERRQQQLHRLKSEFDEKMEGLQKLAFETMQAAPLLDHASPSERENLASILELLPSTTSADLVMALRKAGSHSVSSFLGNSPISYQEVVQAVAIKFGASEHITAKSSADLERIAVGAAVQQMLEKATPEQRAAMLAEISKSQGKSANGLVTATGGLVLANLSGFGLYMAAASSLSALTGAIGLTLPFAAYTGMSSILATVTGPVGWVALAAVAAFKLGGANYKKTMPGVLVIAAARARLIAERDQIISDLRAKSQGTIAPLELATTRLSAFLSSMKQKGLFAFPKSDVPW